MRFLVQSLFARVMVISDLLWIKGRPSNCLCGQSVCRLKEDRGQWGKNDPSLKIVGQSYSIRYEAAWPIQSPFQSVPLVYLLSSPLMSFKTFIHAVNKFAWPLTPTASVVQAPSASITLTSSIDSSSSPRAGDLEDGPAFYRWVDPV